MGLSAQPWALARKSEEGGSYQQLAESGNLGHIHLSLSFINLQHM